MPTISKIPKSAVKLGESNIGGSAPRLLDDVPPPLLAIATKPNPQTHVR